MGKIFYSPMTINALADAKINGIHGCQETIGFAQTVRGEKNAIRML